MIKITFTDRQNTLAFDRRKVRRAVRAILHDAGIDDARIGIAVVDNAEIAALHVQFLNDPTPTDVLSFVLESTETSIEGEIVVSAETAASQAPQFNNSPEQELLLYIIHGMLHLVGYDDTTPRKRAVMRRKEREYLAFLAAFGQ